MIKGSVVLLLIVVLALSPAMVHGQDAAKKSEKSEAKAELKSVSCAPECGFMVRSHDEAEVSSIVIAHAKSRHNKELTEKDVKGMMKTEGKKDHKKEAEKK